MALSGSVKTSSYEGRYVQLDWTATQSVDNNTSTIAWTLKAVGGSSSWYAERTLKVVLGGSTVYSKTARVERKVGTIATGTKTITHDANGNASFSVSIESAIYYSAVNCKGSGSFTLNNIPRKSTLSVANGTLGTAQTLTVTRKSNSFTHTITYTCGSASGTIATKSSSTSISFTPPLSLASQNITGTSVSVKYTITTYNGNTSIGSNSYTVTCAIPASVKPTVSLSVSDAMGYLGTYGGYVQGRSKFKVVVTASGSYSSTIQSYKASADGKSYTSASFTTDVINNTGTLTIIATVTDSRGRTATASTNVTVLAYSVPKITSLTVKRCNSDGSNNSSGAYLGITFNSVVSALNNKNTATYTVKYKKSTDSNYTTATVTNYNNNYNVTGGSYVFEASTSASYDIHLYVADKFDQTGKDINGPSIVKLFSIFKNGLGWAFGKVAEKNGLEIAMDTYINKKLILSDSPPNFGGVRVTTVENSYVRLFTYEMSQRWKHTSIWFTLVDTQANNENLLCNLYANYGDHSEGIRITNLKYVTFNTFDNTRLVAVITNNNTIEVYFKMKLSDSPTISIISMTRHFETDDTYGKITIDCETVKDVLPTGTSVVSSGSVLS